MAKTKSSRNAKQQLGQFMTPPALVNNILTQQAYPFKVTDKILEPSFGEGAFIFNIINRLLPLYPKNLSKEEKVKLILENNIYGVEYDPEMFNKFRQQFYQTYKVNLDEIPHHLILGDFFDYQAPTNFDYIIGNPPFGGTFNPETEDQLDKKYGTWGKYKIKKETYSFFTVACLNYLTQTGKLLFILSDTFLTINTMQGLRRMILSLGDATVEPLTFFSPETDYGMVVLSVKKNTNKTHTLKTGKETLSYNMINSTPNFSWKINKKLLTYFQGPKIGEYMTASSGMTVGKNEYFLRDIQPNGTIKEPYQISICDSKITLERELQKARLHKISPTKQQLIKAQEQAGETEKTVKATPLTEPITIQLPHPNYLPYNKAVNAAYYHAPTTVIYWANGGEAVYTYKKSGAWYLHGVGGKKFFLKEGLTWNLISTKIKARYLPEGYILDSGAPIAVLKPNTQHDELWFILAWLNTNIATLILKTVINHTQNIQGKDIERMPYPYWVTPDNKKLIIEKTRNFIRELQSGTSTSVEQTLHEELETLFAKKELFLNNTFRGRKI